MRISDLVEAIDAAKTLKSYQDKLVSRRPKESTPEEIIRLAVSALSSQQQKYPLLRWLLDHYISGDIKRAEDFSRAARAMEVVSSRGKGIDINHLNFDQLQTKAEEIELIPSKKTKKDELTKDIDLVYSGPEGKIYVFRKFIFLGLL